MLKYKANCIITHKIQTISSKHTRLSKNVNNKGFVNTMVNDTKNYDWSKFLVKQNTE